MSSTEPLPLLSRMLHRANSLHSHFRVARAASPMNPSAFYV